MPVLQNVLRHHNKSPVKYQIPNTKHYINVSVPLGAFSAHINVHLNPQRYISFIHRKGSIISLKSLGGVRVAFTSFYRKGKVCVLRETEKLSGVFYSVWKSLILKYEILQTVYYDCSELIQSFWVKQWLTTMLIFSHAENVTTTNCLFEL